MSVNALLIARKQCRRLSFQQQPYFIKTQLYILSQKMRLKFRQYIKNHVFVNFKTLFISCCLPAIINDVGNVIVLQHY